jgi:hypothetical protein
MVPRIIAVVLYSLEVARVTTRRWRLGEMRCFRHEWRAPQLRRRWDIQVLSALHLRSASETRPQGIFLYRCRCRSTRCMTCPKMGFMSSEGKGESQTPGHNWPKHRLFCSPSLVSKNLAWDRQEQDSWFCQDSSRRDQESKSKKNDDKVKYK